jgi:hypothetical protein
MTRTLGYILPIPFYLCPRRFAGVCTGSARRRGDASREDLSGVDSEQATNIPPLRVQGAEVVRAAPRPVGQAQPGGRYSAVLAPRNTTVAGAGRLARPPGACEAACCAAGPQRPAGNWPRHPPTLLDHGALRHACPRGTHLWHGRSHPSLARPADTRATVRACRDGRVRTPGAMACGRRQRQWDHVTTWHVMLIQAESGHRMRRA